MTHPRSFRQLLAKSFNAGAPDPVLSSPGHEKLAARCNQVSGLCGCSHWLQHRLAGQRCQQVMRTDLSLQTQLNLFRLPFNVLGPHTCQVHLVRDSGHLRPLSLGPSPPTPWQRIPAPGVSLSTSRVLSQEGNSPQHGSWLAFQLCWTSGKPQEETTSHPKSTSGGKDGSSRSS